MPMSEDLIVEILNELDKADVKHGRMDDPEEGLQTVKCEFEELKREMRRLGKDYQAYRKEAVQLAAMGLKFVRDCTRRADFDKCR